MFKTNASFIHLMSLFYQQISAVELDIAGIVTFFVYMCYKEVHKSVWAFFYPVIVIVKC